MVYTEVIVAAINYDFTAEHRPPAERGQQAVKLADLAARLDRLEASAAANRQARAAALNTVTAAVRKADPDPKVTAPTAAEAARQAEKRRRKEQRRHDTRHDGPARGPSIR